MKKILAGFAVAAFAVTASGASAATYTFTRDLTIGSTGADVVALQDVLISNGYLTIPAGTSKGYFGAMTQAAVAKWQAASGITPAAGYFGPKSRAALSMVDSGSNNGGNTDSNTGSNTLKGGDGDFTGFKILGNPNNEDVEEGDTVEVFGFEFEARRSDLQVERVDLLFVEQGSDEDKPWKVLEEVMIVDADGDEVASIDASDEDAWDEEEDDEYSIRFDDVDFVVEEGEKVKLFVAVTANEDLDSDEQGTWKVSLMDDGVRAINAVGIDVYESKTTTKTFSLEEAEAGDLKLTVNDDDNKDDEVSVDEDDVTDEVTLYTALAESKTGDNLIEEITVDIDSSGANLDEIIKTLYVFIDGEEVGSESVGSTTTDLVTFDDIDFEIAEDEEVEILVVADILKRDGNYDNGDSVEVQEIIVDYVDEQDDDLTAESNVVGGEISFSTNAVMVEPSSTSASANGTIGTFKVSFKVTAPEDEDIFIPEFAATSSGDFGATYVIRDGNGNPPAAYAGTTTISEITASGASKSAGHYRVTKGNTATFTVNVEISNAGATGNIARKIALTSVNYSIGSAAASNQQYTAGIDEDFETNAVTIRFQD